MRFHTKAFTSLFLTFAFVALAVSGIVLYIAPRCRVAEDMGWTVMLLDKEQWESIHINAGVFFTLAVVLHLVLNWSLLWCYLKAKGTVAVNRKLELGAAVLLAAIVLAGCILRVPPFQSMLELHDHVKDSWGRPFEAGHGSSGRAPTIQGLSEQMGLSTEQILQALEAEGISLPAPDATLHQIAEANNLRPADIRAAIRHRFPDATDVVQDGPGQGGGRGMGSGQGRGMGSGQGRGMGGGQGRGMRQGPDVDAQPQN